MKCERLVRVPAHYISLGSGLRINTLLLIPIVSAPVLNTRLSVHKSVLTNVLNWCN